MELLRPIVQRLTILHIFCHVNAVSVCFLPDLQECVRIASLHGEETLWVGRSFPRLRGADDAELVREILLGQVGAELHRELEGMDKRKD